MKEHIRIFGPALLLILAGFVLAYQFIQPAPPSHIRMATGSASGAYHLYGQRYVELFAKEGIALELVPTQGSKDNIALLERGDVDVAFVQSGVATADDDSGLRALGSLYYEPIWVFVRKGVAVKHLSDLKDKHIAVGALGSGTYPVALALLQDNKIDANTAYIENMDRETAVAALLAGEIDAAFFITSPKAAVVSQLLMEPTVELMDFDRADAYTHLHHYLSSVVLPRGIIDMQKDIPDRDTRLLTASANLVTTPQLHPALIDLFLQSAQQIHGTGGWFERANQFPSPDHLAFPLLDKARHFYKYGPPFLQRYLPFWAAALINRLKVMILPLLALMLPLIKIMPSIYRWRMRSRIYRWYRDILAVDRQLREKSITAAEAAAALTRVEEDASQTSVPLSFADELYDLRLHIGLVRKKLTLMDQEPSWPDSQSTSGPSTNSST